MRLEKVNPSHPCKVADRIAGAMVDMAYAMKRNPIIDANVAIYNGVCTIFVSSDVDFSIEGVSKIVERIAGDDFKTNLEYAKVEGATTLACKSTGVFKGVFPLREELRAVTILRAFYDGKSMGVCEYKDGKWKLSIKDFDPTVKQNDVDVRNLDIYEIDEVHPYEFKGVANNNDMIVSDMGLSVCGKGLHGKDLSDPNVTLPIFAWLSCQKYGGRFDISCVEGDTILTHVSYPFTTKYDKNGLKFADVVKEVKKFIDSRGGFEKFAEWGLLKPYAFDD